MYAMQYAVMKNTQQNWVQRVLMLQDIKSFVVYLIFNAKFIKCALLKLINIIDNIHRAQICINFPATLIS